MPEQTPIDRTSLTVNLENRYSTQRCGGAYDAKSVVTKQSGRMPILGADGISSALTETRWTNENFLVQTPFMKTELKESSLNFLDSLGFSNRKYKP